MQNPTLQIKPPLPVDRLVLVYAYIALTKLPNHVYFLETRGQILVKLKRWQEAIPNLEVALEAEELRPAIYPSLALAYEKIGATDLTQFYQNLAKGVPQFDRYINCRESCDLNFALVESMPTPEHPRTSK